MKKSLFARSLDRIEVVGNALPHPATIFGILALLVVVASFITSVFNVQALHPGTKEIISIKNLLSTEGIRWMFENVEDNFINFPPLGLVLVAMVGIGVAEGSGLLKVLIRTLVIKAPNCCWCYT